MQELPIEVIVWEDHYSTDDWVNPDDETIHESVYVTSLGYRLRETKTKVVLVSNRATNGQVFGTVTILKKTIKSRRVVSEVDLHNRQS